MDVAILRLRGLKQVVMTIVQSSDSTSGYAVVTYLRVTGDDGKAHCEFVMGKTRLAPLKAVTVSRLELQSATLATRQDQFLRRVLDIELGESTFWSDSTVVLLSINNTSKHFTSWRIGFLKSRRHRDQANGSTFRRVRTQRMKVREA